MTAVGNCKPAPPIRPQRLTGRFLVDFFVARFLVDRLVFFFVARFLVDRLVFFAARFLVARFLVDRLAFFFLVAFFLVARFLVDRLVFFVARFTFFLATFFFGAIFLPPWQWIPETARAHFPPGILREKVAWVSHHPVHTNRGNQGNGPKPSTKPLSATCVAPLVSRIEPIHPMVRQDELQQFCDSTPIFFRHGKRQRECAPRIHVRAARGRHPTRPFPARHGHLDDQREDSIMALRERLVIRTLAATNSPSCVPRGDHV